MQTTATIIRTARTAQKINEGSVQFRARQAEVAALLERVLTHGQPEVFEGSTRLCTNYKLRHGCIGDDACQVQITTHYNLVDDNAGHLLRFWVFGPNFEAKTRDLVLLPAGGDKGWEMWLLADGRLFPHEGKYALVATRIMCNYLFGN